MSTLKIRSISIGRCTVTHPSGTTVTTDLPVEYGGEGRSFSATDLLAASLGVCIATNIDKVAERHGVPPENIEIEMKKTLSDAPKRITGLEVSVNISANISEELKKRLQRASDHCLVHKSLHPVIPVTITIN